MTYDPDSREYLLGKIASDYYYKPGEILDYNHVRKVQWEGRVGRDLLTAEVKHRQKTSIGAQDIRSFTGGLREGHRGLFISTGGFTKESKYEAERSTMPCTLIDLDELASLVIDYYDNFDVEGRALIPLIKVYWPVE